MSYFLQTFGDLSFATVIIFVAAMCFFISLCSKLYNILVKNHDSFQTRIKILDSISDELKEIKDNQKTMQTQIKETQDKLNALETESREITLNKLRDKLLQSYRYYTNPEKNPSHTWTDMEKEAFEALFHDYERCGGNGYMHTEVWPKMQELLVVQVSDTSEMEKLIENRKG